MMNNMNLDINNYLIEELENLLNLRKPYDRNMLFNKINFIKNDINNSDLSESKRTSYTIFLDNVYTRLINELIKTDNNNNNNNNNNNISQFDSNHFLIKSSNLKYDSVLESNKKINKSIIKKSIVIDSLYRSNYSMLSTTSTNFTIELPEVITNAVTLSITSLEIPLTYHNISLALNNNVFDVEVFNASDNSVFTKQISLLSGIYEARFINQEKAYNIETEINDKINFIFSNESNNADNTTEQQNIAIDLSNNLKFYVNKQSGVSFFQYNNNNSDILDISSGYKIKINFNVNNNDQISDCDDNELYQKLGWSLGFITNDIILDNNNLGANNIVQAISNNICNINYPRYIYIAIDDFQTSARNYLSIAAKSVMAPNIITRINIQSLLEDNSAYKSGAEGGDLYYTQKNVREYFGPTNIKKLKISLLDEYCRSFSLNNVNWSFIANFECIYNN